jgi:hypothetical protein
MHHIYLVHTSIGSYLGRIINSINCKLKHKVIKKILNDLLIDYPSYGSAVGVFSLPIQPTTIQRTNVQYITFPNQNSDPFL